MVRFNQLLSACFLIGLMGCQASGTGKLYVDSDPISQEQVQQYATLIQSASPTAKKVIQNQYGALEKQHSNWLKQHFPEYTEDQKLALLSLLHIYLLENTAEQLKVSIVQDDQKKEALLADLVPDKARPNASEDLIRVQSKLKHVQSLVMPALYPEKLKTTPEEIQQFIKQNGDPMLKTRFTLTQAYFMPYGKKPHDVVKQKAKALLQEVTTTNLSHPIQLEKITHKYIDFLEPGYLKSGSQHTNKDKLNDVYETSKGVLVYIYKTLPPSSKLFSPESNQIARFMLLSYKSDVEARRWVGSLITEGKRVHFQ